ncbi:BnaA01g23400D [Brassica napus]|uniref:BnaA01g23400D protein n=1 Tax=Brassica napus TaxID=3708 RepID=A0A078FY96_BRANA|nr:BnaA01g23400D [Brassica napus]
MTFVDENLGFTPESLMSYSKMMSDKLGHSGTKSLLSLIDAFKNERITPSVFSKSVVLLFHKHKNTEGEIRGYNVSDEAVRAKVDEKPKRSGARIRIRGKKRRIIHSEPTTERSLKRARTSRRLLERVTPSYKLIPEEEQCPVSDNHVLNNKYAVMQFNGSSKPKKLSKYEEAIESCEEDMFETDMLIESLKSAVENAEKVLKEEMSVEDLGVKFYRCIKMVYRGDVSEIVREDHKKALPAILERLKQKLDALTVAKESWKPRWKQVFEENTAKQRKATRKN